MRRFFIVLFCSLFLFSTCASANVPEIIIDGVVVQERRTHVLLDAAARMQEMLLADLSAGNQWYYHEGGANGRVVSLRQKNNTRWTTCADSVCMVIHESGLVPMDVSLPFFGSKDGTIHFGGNSRAVMSSIADIHQYNDGSTVGSLIDSGQIRAGDIVTYVGFNHTNLYAGDDYWYDFGHAGCIESGDWAKFSTWYAKRPGNRGLKVGGVIHIRDEYAYPEPDIVITDITEDILVTDLGFVGTKLEMARFQRDIDELLYEKFYLKSMMR